MKTIVPTCADSALRRRRFETEMETIRKEAAQRFAHLPRPLKTNDGPWGFYRSRRRVP